MKIPSYFLIHVSSLSIKFSPSIYKYDKRLPILCNLLTLYAHTYREIDVAVSFTTHVIDSHHELIKRYNEGTLSVVMLNYKYIYVLPVLAVVLYGILSR